MAVQPRRYRFTAAEYHRLAEAGILGEDDRVELIDGEIIEMSPIGSRHMAGVNRLNRRLVRAVGDAAIVSVQNPIQVGDHHEPQPDVTVLRPRADDYASAVPIAEDVLLVVEVADSSADYDRGTKAPLYARGGIAELWIVDLNRDHLVVYRDPTSAGYATTRVLRRGESIRPLAFPELEITVDEILG
jgi:Uma2 family endonuclease